MCEVNQTQITHVRLLGFRGLYEFKILLFIVFLLTYIVILSANSLIIILVTTSDQLKIPMFFFLKHLAVYDVLLTTTVVPLILDVIVKGEGKVSLVCCIIQLYCLCIITYLQCFLIAAMSYDRYLAICHPLRYSSFMNSQIFLQLVIGFWVLVILLETSEIIVMLQLSFCGLNSVDHFFCDYPVVALSTSDITVLVLHDFIVTIVTELFPFIFIILTYICILVAILKISSSSGRKKAFSTCSSHLSTVCTFYGSLIIIYMAPSEGGSTSTNKYRTLLYIVVSPLMNPIIYSLRNHEIKKAMKRFVATFRTVDWK
ncbi:olfactory receptor 10A3-like [Hyperolius riggenbachi]|uniref:olfactory receptor 10A3-like n=1 Tax=Hyperolius riggenbachi TaxID=752182 RepID=UPI0035A3395C